ncbi:MAG TPA: aminotransferase class V-fold PLP-dependent enzyme [Gemmataceae bacterium]|nr:aminotransferase class V-fold PLP-dependent enzyme [Gemmataceae bacterium]
MTTDATDPLCRYRGRFPILAQTNYLISNSLGAVPAAASRSLQEYFEAWATRGVRAWEEGWWTMAADLGDLVAPLIGARAGDVVFQPNVTLAHAVAFSAFDFHGRRPRVVTDAMHFPSILYLIAEQASQGAEVVIVPTDDGITVDTGRVIEAIDEHTAFVSLSHVLFKSAYIHDLAAVGRRAREVGALTIIDGYQAVGSIPVDVTALGLDVYIGGCLKWLCGGPGAAFLWVRPELQPRLRPRLTGWMAHAHPFDFAPVHERRPDAWRFLHGTPNIPAFYAARPGLEIINEVGMPAIRAKSSRQTARLVVLGEAHGWRCTTPRDPTRRAGPVAIDVEHGYEVSRALKAGEIICDYRPGAGVRLSPHFYTLDEELEAAVAAIRDILRSGAWERFAGGHTTVT